MTEPKRKIVVQDVTEKIKNPRQELLNDQELQKPFIFKGYTTEKERIKDTIKNNRYIYNIPEPELKKKINNNISNNIENNSLIITNKTQNNSQNETNIDFYNSTPLTFAEKYEMNLLFPSTKRINDGAILNSNEIEYFIKNNIILQPQMRFKARTDLERVYEALSGKYNLENEKNILNRQLKKIDLFTFKKPKDLLKLNTMRNKSDITYDIEEEKEEINKINNKKNYKVIPQTENIIDKEEEKRNKRNLYLNNTLYYIPTKNERWKKRTDLNKEAEGILKDYHYKTHFKAAEEIAENKLDYKKIKDIENINLLKSNRILKKKKNPFNFDCDIEKKLKNEEIIPYSKNYNPIIKSKDNTVDYDSMRVLTKLAFMDNSNLKKNDDEENNLTIQNADIENKKKLIDENNVLIGNEILYKGTQFNLIANRVLNLCNVYHKKDRHNNTSLKKGTGKMMFTQGLSVNDFEKKYNLDG